jgi:hypothetical protein
MFRYFTADKNSKKNGKPTDRLQSSDFSFERFKKLQEIILELKCEITQLILFTPLQENTK